MKKLFAVWALLVIVVAGVIAAQAAKPQAASPKGFRIEKAASLGAGAGLYVTTISKGAYQSPSSVSFQSLSKSFTSSAVAILDQTVSSGTASSVMTAAGTGASPTNGIASRREPRRLFFPARIPSPLPPAQPPAA